MRLVVEIKILEKQMTEAVSTMAAEMGEAHALVKLRDMMEDLENGRL